MELMNDFAHNLSIKFANMVKNMIDIVVANYNITEVCNPLQFE